MERYDAGEFIGWGIDKTRPDNSAVVFVLVDGVPVTSLQTSDDRPDVSDLGLRGGRAGFRFKVPERFRDGRPRRFSFRFDSGARMPVIRDDEKLAEDLSLAIYPDEILQSHVDGLQGHIICGWAMLLQPLTGVKSGGLEIVVRENGVELHRLTCNLIRPDVAAIMGGDGRCGFAYRPPLRCRDGGRYELEFLLASTMQPLLGSPHSFAFAEELAQTYYVSCNPDELYKSGGFNDTELMARLVRARYDQSEHITDIGEVFPAYHYVRPEPQRLLGPNARTIDDQRAHFQSIIQNAQTGPAVRLVHLRDAYVYNNQLLHIAGDEVLTIYESARPLERPYMVRKDWTANALRESAQPMAPQNSALYLGSVGFSNYGHWLCDDLPRMAALDAIMGYSGDDRVTLVIPGASHVLNARKEESLRFLKPDLLTEDLLFIPHELPLYFPSLYYVTPTTRHPVLKSPAALDFLRAAAIDRPLGPSTAQKSDKIFVTRRSERGRRLLNRSAVLKVFKRHGFQAVDAEVLTFAEQVALFRNARIVAGAMGAAMTNTLFCQPGTQLIYLAPDGWMEPFYWDLAAVCRHSYNVLFGASTDSTFEPHKADFTIDVKTLSAVLESLDSPEKVNTEQRPPSP